MEIEEYYQIKQNCFNDLQILRKEWGKLSFSLEQAQQGWKTLILMHFHCPDEIQYIVEAHIDEFEKRMSLMGITEYIVSADLTGNKK